MKRRKREGDGEKKGERTERVEDREIGRERTGERERVRSGEQEGPAYHKK